MKKTIGILLSVLVVLSSCISVSAYPNAANTSNTTANSDSSSITLAKKSKKYTDFPQVIDFGALTNTKLSQICYYNEVNTYQAIYLYKINGDTEKKAKKYINLLLADNFVDKGSMDLSELNSEANVYSHKFTKSDPGNEISVWVLYGIDEPVIIDQEPTIVIDVIMDKNKAPSTLKSITAYKGKHEPSKYAQHLNVPDFGSYTNSCLRRVKYASVGLMNVTGYMYDISSITDKKILDYVSLCEKSGYTVTNVSDNGMITLMPNDIKKNPYSIFLLKNEDEFMVCVSKANYKF